MRKIRARLRGPGANQWQQEIIQAGMSALVAPRQQEQQTDEIMQQGQTLGFPSTKELSQSQTEEGLWLSYRSAEAMYSEWQSHARGD